MLLSCTLICFLIATFVAAAPTSTTPPLSKKVFIRLEENREFFVHAGGSWTPVKLVNYAVTRMEWRLYTLGVYDKLEFQLADPHLSSQWHRANVFVSKTFDERIVESLCGAYWERKTTGSIIKIHFKDEEHTVIEVLEKGTWAGDFITEGEAELSKKVPVRLEENKAFFADAGGLWTPMNSANKAVASMGWRLQPRRGGYDTLEFRLEDKKLWHLLPSRWQQANGFVFNTFSSKVVCNFQGKEWIRTTTNSIIKIDLQKDYTKIEVLNKGTWSGDIIREKEAARPRTPS